jgi:hypothetical protein
VHFDSVAAYSKADAWQGVPDCLHPDFSIMSSCEGIIGTSTSTADHQQQVIFSSDADRKYYLDGPEPNRQRYKPVARELSPALAKRRNSDYFAVMSRRRSQSPAGSMGGPT